jgi:protein O-mannosyl-transferase
MAAPKSKRSPPARAARPPSLRLIAAAFLAAAFLAYIPALGAHYIWDDESYVTGNETLRTMGGLAQIWLEPWATPQYYPLVHTTFWLEYRFWGLAPAGYHAVNLLLHASCGVLVYLLLRRLALPGALLAAALFVLHPVHVESVAWITERKNVLSALFYLSAMLAYLRFRPLNEGGGTGRRDYFLALALFAGALLSKTVTASMPAAFLLLIYWKEGRLTRRDVLLLVPFFVLGLVAGGNTAWLEKHRVGAYGEDWALSPAERVLIAGRAVWFYFGKLLWPNPLVFIYPRWELDTRSLVQWAFPVTAVLAVGVLAALRTRIGRGPLVAALFFGGTLFPALGFFDVYPMRFSFVADHFQYLASLGILALLAALGARALDRPDRRTVAQGAAALWLLALGTITYTQSSHYRDYETLWLDTLAKNPGCWMARNNLGLLYEKTGRVEDAIAQYRLALEAKPRAADAHTNLGNVLLAAGRRAEAMTHLREAVQLAPDSSEAWNNLGGGLTEAGETREALECYRRATAIDPEDARLRLNLGTALATSGDLDGAIAALGAAEPRLSASHAPALAAARFNLGNALFQSNRVEHAAEQYRLALRLRPDDIDARINLGYSLVRLGRGAEALPLFREALARDPSSKRAQAGLAMVGAAPAD